MAVVALPATPIRGEMAPGDSGMGGEQNAPMDLAFERLSIRAVLPGELEGFRCVPLHIWFFWSR